jgi:LysM repeat protein
MKTKLKIPKLFTFRRKKLRVRTGRRAVRMAAAANYDEMAEPNMKLSRALLIVLLLHVVAVAGIIAFNAIKTRQRSFSFVPGSVSAATSSAVSTTKPAPASTAPQRGNAKGTKDSTKTDRPNLPVESGKTYVVARGDNPVTIAKKFKVPYDDLVELNHIDDPRKLQIGQKLLIPAKTTKARKSE